MAGARAGQEGELPPILLGPQPAGYSGGLVVREPPRRLERERKASAAGAVFQGAWRVWGGDKDARREHPEQGRN